MPGLKDAIATIFGGRNPLDSVKDLIGEFHMSPEDKQKALDAAEAKFQHWRDFESKIMELDNANTASAREMNEKIQGDKPSWMARNIGYLIDILLVSVWAALTFYIVARALHIIDTEGKSVDFTTVLGIYAGVSTMAGTVVNFHRGSSQGSADKSKMIDRLTS